MKWKGYTLIEVVLAVAVIALLLIPLGNLIQQGLNINVRAQRTMEFSEAISKAYEEVMHFLKDVEPDFEGTGESIESKDENGNTVYKITYTVSDYDTFNVGYDVYNYEEVLKKVDFTVQDSKGNKVKELTYFIRVIKP